MAATVPRVAVDGDVIWSERELAGTRPYRVTQLLRGVIIFGASGEELAGLGSTSSRWMQTAAT